MEIENVIEIGFPEILNNIFQASLNGVVYQNINCKLDAEEKMTLVLYKRKE